MGFLNSILPARNPAPAPMPKADGSGQQVVLETDGMVCPFPLVEAKSAMESLAAGDNLVINFDCTQATDAIPHWAAENGYPVTKFEKRGAAEWTIVVQKA